MKLWPFRHPPTLVLGTTAHRFWPVALQLGLAQARAHMHVIGVSGSGKSRFLAGLYLELLRHQLPATLIDPHGDLAQLILAHLVARGAYRSPATFDRIVY